MKRTFRKYPSSYVKASDNYTWDRDRFDTIVGKIIEFWKTYPGSHPQKDYYDYLAQFGIENVDAEEFGKAFDKANDIWGALPMSSRCVNASTDIINTNNGDYEITPFGEGFTVQLEGDEVYFDTYKEALAAIMEDAGQAVNATTDVTASKTLCVQHGNTVSRYKFARVDGRGDEYTGDDWFESYIVTPQGELLTWTLNGNYIPSAREFWVEDDDQGINCATETDGEFKAVPLRSLKKGAWFTIKPIAEPTDRQVYIKDDYDREEKKFMCGRCDDISYSTYFKGDKMVYDDSNFDY